MKKLFVSILALAAFAACQSNFNDVTTNTPGLGDDVVPEGMVRIYAEVGIGEEGTKATYDDNLNAKWEESDQIALLQESANYGETFGHVNFLNIKSGAGTSYAAFNGDITVPTESPRVYHIAYPASAVEFSTNVSVEKSGDSSYETKVSTPGVAYFRSNANFDYKYTSSVSVNVPTTQNGKWEPYMYASTEEAVNSNAIGAKTLTTLTGAIAIRAYEADGTTPKQLKSISVTATKPIAGAFSDESASVATLNVTGDYTSKTYSTEIEGDFIIEGRDKAKAAADELLESKAQSTVPANTSVTKALSLSFAGEEYTVKAEDTAWVAADENGVYTYHLNVAPFEGADLTITATAVDGSTLVRTISGQSLAAAHRKGYNFKWETAAFGYEAIHTWYDNYKSSPFTLASNTIHVGGVKVTGSVTEQNVTAIGVRIYNEADESLYTEVVDSNKLSFATDVSGIPSGRYIVKVFADIVVNGVATTKEFSDTKIVTAIPEFTEDSYVRSSYSRNGDVKLDNSVGGGDLRVKTVLNDSYLAANLVDSYTFYYTHNGETKTVNPTLGQERNITFGYDKWGQYDCYVNILLKNGYSFSTTKYATHITGIPYTLNTSSNDGSWAVGTSGNTDTSPVNWNTDGGVRLGSGQTSSDIYITKSFYIPENVTVKVTANGINNGTGSKVGFIDARVANTATITVGSTVVVNNKQNGNDEASWSCSSANASMSSSNNTVKLNSNYNLAGAKVVLKALTIQY